MKENKNTVILRGSFVVEYSNFADGDYSPYLRVSGNCSLSELVSQVRKSLISAPSFVRSQIAFQHFNARFWFRVRHSDSSCIQFHIDISSAELNTIHSRRVAAL